MFDLGKENRFNITGEFTIETQGDIQNYELTAIHPNRTIVWTSQFKSVDKTSFHNSKIELAKNVWLSYNVEVSNHTTSAAESQELKFKISYPDRELSIDGLYLLKTDSLDTDVKARWIKTKRSEESDSSEVTEEPEVEEKNVAAKLQWLDHESNTLGKDHQSVILSLKHPSFDKDVMLTGSYYRDGFNMTSLEIDFDYTEDEDHHAKFKSEIRNMTAEAGFKNYTISLFASHIASELNLAFDGSMGLQPKNYKIEAAGSYKRGYLPEMELELIGFIDTETKEAKFYVRSETGNVKKICNPIKYFSDRHRTSESTSTQQRWQIFLGTQLTECSWILLNMKVLELLNLTSTKKLSMPTSTLPRVCITSFI